MLVHTVKHIYVCGIAIISVMVAMLVFSACSPSHKVEVDRLNSMSYAYHYRNLDSTKLLADSALKLSGDYSAGYAEACNNLAFVATAKMDYRLAKRWLNEVETHSDNQIELLIADVQNMRLCQREARNKEFYFFREKAIQRLRRITEEQENLPLRESKRVIYAQSEFYIVAATYFYYVQQEKPMRQALSCLEAEASQLEQDTAQYLNYLYNFGSGGAFAKGTPQEIHQKEFDYLINLYMLASGPNPYPYWQANALQAISEHILNTEEREMLVRNNLPAFQYLNVEQMPVHLLAGNLAQRALNLFTEYGDVYQTAGAQRTLAECYWKIHDYFSAAQCLQHALGDNRAILQAPDLVASIREQLSLVYSAIDDKPQSDYNRNAYLDLQEMSRQDKQLEARAAQLDNNAIWLNSMIAAVIAMIVLVVVLLYVFDHMKRKKAKGKSIDELLMPLREWSKSNELKNNEMQEKREELIEERNVVQMHIDSNKKRNLEQRAKVQLVNSIMPFIDRMIHEVDRLCEGGETDEVRKERLQYISELTDKINQYHDVLTQWIQMRQGSLSLRIESFPLQPLFDIVAKGKMNFQMKGVDLCVKPTDAVVKADRTLTLFMVNTIADNARKFTPSGGKVCIRTTEHSVGENMMPGQASLSNYVEIVISDTGKGMDEEQLAHVFDRTYTGGHGFGLVNCKGIIEKYKKLSQVFGVCDIHAESKVGEGSAFSFRLPCGIGKKTASAVHDVFGAVLLFLGASCLSLLPMKSLAAVDMHHTHHQQKVDDGRSSDLQRADDYADSAYFSNINGTYERTLEFADSSLHYLNRYYLSQYPGGKFLMVRHPQVGTIAELQWLHDSLPTNYEVILDLRNETAVAALALHKWELYASNNKVYTQLFRELSADKTLDEYVRTMQVSETSKTVAVVLLVLLLLQLPLAYYLLYYRHVLGYRFAEDKVNAINQVLLSHATDADKLCRIRELWDKNGGQKLISSQLDEVVNRIEQALEARMRQEKDEVANMELAQDELHRAEYENDKLHISNSVLDNCLSALKHETMYYPSRIRQLIDSHPEDLESLRELVVYYKSLYQLLSAQAMEQVEGNVRYDEFLNRWLLDLMKGDSRQYVVKVARCSDNQYSTLCIEQRDVVYDESLHNLLFTPLTSDLSYLLCRQIIRELGEVTNLRGCGIRAMRGENGALRIEALIPAKAVFVDGRIES